MNLRSKSLSGLVVIVSATIALGVWQLRAVMPAPSQIYQSWLDTAPDAADRGAALLAFGNFGALDLDTLETSALPWTIIATALALRATDGDPEQVGMGAVAAAFKSYGFVFPKSIDGHPDLKPSADRPLGLSIGVIERSVPPIRVTGMTLGCAACHASVSYRSDGTPDPDVAVLGRPNTAIDLEAFAQDTYAAVKRALKDEDLLMRAMRRLFPDLTRRERWTLEWLVLPKLRKRVAELQKSIDRPTPFNNGAPGLTNGVAALKVQLGLAAQNHYVDGAGFVSIPDLADRNFRSALLADGAYAPVGNERFRPIAAAEAETRDVRKLAGIASFFMVPTMGMTSSRAERAIPELVPVLSYLAKSRPPRFPGPVDVDRAGAGRLVYARACAACHGTYDASLTSPRLTVFPNWAGDVGTDRARVDAFDVQLKLAVDRTDHGRRIIDAAATGVIAAPPLSGIWSSAPYLTNGSIPTLRHLLEPDTRPQRFMTGGHRLDLSRIGIAGRMSPDGTWAYATDYRSFSKPVVIDTRKPGFSNRGHDRQVQELTGEERTDLLEYLKLL